MCTSELVAPGRSVLREHEWLVIGGSGLGPVLSVS